MNTSSPHLYSSFGPSRPPYGYEICHMIAGGYMSTMFQKVDKMDFPNAR